MTKTILIVDDSRTHRSLLKVFLAGHGFTFLEADNGKQAEAILDKEHVDLAILDLNMPELDGLTLLRRIRSSGRSEISGLKVILLTGEKDKAQVSEASRGGANALLRKPVSSAGALEAVLDLLRPAKP